MCKHGSTKPVKLNRPRPVSGRWVVPVDACIADEVQKMNDLGIVTHGSCCGHGGGRPTVLIEEESVALTLSAGYAVQAFRYGEEDFQGVYQVFIENGSGKPSL